MSRHCSAAQTGNWPNADDRRSFIPAAAAALFFSEHVPPSLWCYSTGLNSANSSQQRLAVLTLCACVQAGRLRGGPGVSAGDADSGPEPQAGRHVANQSQLPLGQRAHTHTLYNVLNLNCFSLQAICAINADSACTPHLLQGINIFSQWNNFETAASDFWRRRFPLLMF